MIKRSSTTKNVIPGFEITLGYTVFYLTLIVIIPLAGLFIQASHVSFDRIAELMMDKRVLAAFRVTFSTSLFAALINLFLGFIVAWCLVRYKFPCKKLVDSLIDIPFALPTAVAGIAISALYAGNGFMGKFLSQYGIKIAYSPAGIVMALVFVSFPFVVRTVQPVLVDLEKEYEEVAASLGATRFQTFRKVIFPSIFPSLLTGFSMSFARSLGEYGSVIFIAGNIPMVSEIVPLLIVIKLEQYQVEEATVIACFALIIAFALLFLINMIQKWNRKFEDKYR